MGGWTDRWMKMKEVYFHQATSSRLFALLYLKSMDAESGCHVPVACHFLAV